MADPDRLRRVFHVTGGLDVGGQEKLLVEFARHADRERFALHFVCLGARGPLARDLEVEGWPVTTLDTPSGLRPSLVLRLARLFRIGGADAVHTHNERPLIYAAPAARLAGVRHIVHTRHGRGVGLSRRQTLLARLAARAASAYVCVSADCAALSVAQGVHGVEMLHNGIDTRKFAFRGPCAAGPAVIVARLSPEKDIATLLQAVARVVRVRPAFRLVVAGAGPCMPELQSLANDLGVAGYVQFRGLVHDVAGLLAQASMYVLSSVSEGVSLTLLEAMARGLPVVATRVGGTPEVVQDEQTGLLVPPREPAALAAALVRLIDEPALARRLGTAGRQRVVECFDVRNMVAAYEQRYVGFSPATITEDRHDAVDDGLDRSARQRRDARRAALAATARD